MKLFARIISWVFLPLFAPIYALAIALYIPSLDSDFLQRNSLYALPSEVKLAILLMFTLFCVMAPSIVIVFMRMQGMLSSVMLDNRKERYIPALATMISGIGLVYMVYTKANPSVAGYYFLMGIALGSLITVVLCTLITFKYKISLHAAGMGILCGFLMAYFSEMKIYYLSIVVVAFLMSGVVMSMRMALGAHNLRQSLYGYAIGFVVTLYSCISLLYYGN
jgi:hypothetical protein